MKVEAITIDEKKYAIISEIKNDSITYIFLGNIEEESDIMIKKILQEDPNTLIALENEEEFKKALLLFLDQQI